MAWEPAYVHPPDQATDETGPQLTEKSNQCLNQTAKVKGFLDLEATETSFGSLQSGYQFCLWYHLRLIVRG